MNTKRYAPNTIEELQALLAGNTDDLRILGGGTDLAIELRENHQHPQGLIWLGNIEEAKGIEKTEEGLLIGAMTTMAELAESRELSAAYQSLVMAAEAVGSEQIRSSATLGGNIANAAPAADTLPPLMLLDAQVQIAGSGGLQWRTLKSILSGEQRLSRNEAIIKIRLPKNKDGFKTVFNKLGSRQRVTISRLSLALGVTMDGNVITDAKAYAGAIGLIPLEFEQAPNVLKGRIINPQTTEIFAGALSDLVKQAIPGRASLEYKAWSARAVAADTLAKLV